MAVTTITLDPIVSTKGTKADTQVPLNSMENRAVLVRNFNFIFQYDLQCLIDHSPHKSISTMLAFN
jgi:hypothetical protein